MRQARAYAMVAFGWVGAYARVGAYASFKKTALSGIVSAWEREYTFMNCEIEPGQGTDRIKLALT
jgi:hypothetical protein